MLATNHGLTGIILGAYLPLPIAIPVAFASHFVMDALPHFGIPHEQRNSSRAYKMIVVCDTVLALSFAVALIPLQKWRMEAVGWVAYAPDGLWVLYYFTHGRDFHLKPSSAFQRFHMNIQRYERPWGLAIELTYLAIIMPVVFHLMLG